MRPAQAVIGVSIGTSGRNRLVVARSVDPGAWNDAVSACNGTMFHAAQWASYVSATQPTARPIYYSLVADDGAVMGTSLAFCVESTRRLAAPLSRRQWLEAPPAVRDGSPATAAEFLKLIEAHARDAGALRLRVGSFWSPDTETLLAPLEYALTNRFEFELDLDQDEQVLWEGMEAKRRRNIRKAMRAGVDVRVLSGEEGAPHLRRLLNESFIRVAARGGPRQPPIPRGPDPVSTLTTAGFGRLVGGFIDGVCVSASFFNTFNDQAYFTLGGHDAKALETQAPTLVLWKMFLEFRNEGIRRLNFGGCSATAIDETSPEHGVYAYKKAFGGRQLLCTTGDKVLRPGMQKIVNFLGKARL